MSSLSTCAVLFCLVVSVYSQWPSFGGCPSVRTQDKLDIQRYLGDWYELYRFPTIFEKGGCAKASYSLKPNGHIRVDNREVVKGEVTHVIGDVYRPDDSKEGKLLVRFGDLQPYGDYWVVHTDYDTFTLIYTCGGIAGLAHIETAWILGRNMTLDPTITQNLFDELASYNVDVSKFKTIDQSGCPP